MTPSLSDTLQKVARPGLYLALLLGVVFMLAPTATPGEDSGGDELEGDDETLACGGNL